MTFRQKITGLLLLVISAYCPTTLANTYTVGVVPQFDTRTLYKVWQPILDILSEQTGHKFVFSGSPDIPTFEKEFAAGKFDFAYMNPYHFTIAKHYQPILKDNGRKLFGIIVVRSDNSITKIEQLQGGTIVFPAPNALGASLMIRSELEDNFGIQVTPKYVKTHSSVYLNVALGLASAGGGVQKTFNQLSPDIMERLTVLYKTDSVAPHPFTAKKTLDPSIVEQVTSAFLAMGQNDAHKALLAKVPFKEIGVAVDNDYDQVRSLKLERYYVAPGL